MGGWCNSQNLSHSCLSFSGWTPCIVNQAANLNNLYYFDLNE